MKHQILSAVVGAMLLTGCAGSMNGGQGQTPTWVMNPSSANGYAEAGCVGSSGNFSIDRNHAISLARNALAEDMNIKVNVLEKNYQKLNDAAGVATAGLSYEQIAKQITSVALQKSHVEQVALVSIGSAAQVCALVVMPKTESDAIFNAAVPKKSALNPTSKAALYQEFIQQKTAKELEAQTL